MDKDEVPGLQNGGQVPQERQLGPEGLQQPFPQSGQVPRALYPDAGLGRHL